SASPTRGVEKRSLASVKCRGRAGRLVTTTTGAAITAGPNAARGGPARAGVRPRSRRARAGAGRGQGGVVACVLGCGPRTLASRPLLSWLSTGRGVPGRHVGGYGRQSSPNRPPSPSAPPSRADHNGASGQPWGCWQESRCHRGVTEPSQRRGFRWPSVGGGTVLAKQLRQLDVQEAT